MEIERKCSVEGCEGKHRSKGFCYKHYQKWKTYGDPLFTKHKGNTSHYLYGTYHSMKQRCYNVNSVNYSYYGGRGITVCTRWLEDFWNFIEDMGNRSEGMSLDRKDNDGNYEPNNCRWSTKIEQQSNRRLYQKKQLK